MTNKNLTPKTNIDGTPMVPDTHIDVAGKPYGTTDDHGAINTAITDINDSCLNNSFDDFGSDNDPFDSGFDDMSSSFDDGF